MFPPIWNILSDTRARPPVGPAFSGDKHVNTFSDIWQFLKVRKKFWLLPLIATLLLLGVLVVLGAGTSIAPFIYTIF